MTYLRITLRAIDDDLKLDWQKYATSPVEDFQDQHEVVSSFVAQRSQSPVGAETTRLPVSRIVAYNLHAGRYRGLTWHDRDSDIVWLLCAGWHESGSHDDAYAVFQRIDRSGDLLPTAQDYEAFEHFRSRLGEPSFEDIATVIVELGPKIVESAASSPVTR